jgi:hypothetical protein
MRVADIFSVTAHGESRFAVAKINTGKPHLICDIDNMTHINA